jgi:hypothetical protein
MKDFIFGFLGIVGSFGIVQVMLSRDAEAITKCRFLCFELKRLLEELADYLTFPSRNSQNDLPRLKEIKKVIEQLYVEKEGLTFRCALLNNCLEESLPLFDKLRRTDGNPSNSPHFVASELLQAWGLELTRPFKVSQLLGVEKFLYKSFVKRFFAWICNLYRRTQKCFMKKESV